MTDFEKHSFLLVGISSIGWLIFLLWYRYGVSEEKRQENRLRYLEWVHGHSYFAKVFRVFIWFLMIFTALHAFLTSIRFWDK